MKRPVPRVRYGGRSALLLAGLVLAFLPRAASADGQGFSAVAASGVGGLAVVEGEGRIVVVVAALGPAGPRMSLGVIEPDMEACVIRSTTEDVDAVVRVEGSSVVATATTAALGALDLRWTATDTSAPVGAWSRHLKRYGFSGCQTEEFAGAVARGDVSAAALELVAEGTWEPETPIASWTFMGEASASMAEAVWLELPGGG